MNTQAFGKLITYRGKFLSRAKSLAQKQNGNLVFAEIIDSTTLDSSHDDYDKDGYYIYAGGAESHLVNFQTFTSLKQEVVNLQSKLVGIDSTVVDYINNVISNLGTVMEFVGVTDEEITNESTNKPTDLYPNTDPKKGDVIVSGVKEFVWNGTSWREIGQVKADEAVTSLGGEKGDILLGDGLSINEVDGTKTLNIDIPTYTGENAIDITDNKVTLKTSDTGNVTLTNDANGLSANVNAEDISYSNTSHFDQESTIDNVKAALDEIFDDEKVIAEALVDLNDRVNYTEQSIKDINDSLGNLSSNINIESGDDFINVDKNGDKYTITANVIESASTNNNGLVTDGYVLDIISDSFAWNELNDPEVVE